jgi:hypothetical protein
MVTIEHETITIMIGGFLMNRRFVIYGAVLAIAVMVWCGMGCQKSYRVLERYSGEAAKNLLLNRPWLDEFPEKPEQKFMVYVFSDENVGAHDKADSAYRHLLEIFMLRASTEKISFLFPHDKRKADSSFKVERISRKGQFDLKLTLEHDPQLNGKSYVYFSCTEWEIKNHREIPAFLKPCMGALH